MEKIIKEILNLAEILSESIIDADVKEFLKSEWVPACLLHEKNDLKYMIDMITNRIFPPLILDFTWEEEAEQELHRKMYKTMRAWQPRLVEEAEAEVVG